MKLTSCSLALSLLHFTVFAQSPYQYSVPQTNGDGWTVAGLSQVGINQSAVEEAVQVILDGTYTGIDGLIMVRHGLLVLDETFRTQLDVVDRGLGNQNIELHSMQSTTKSITSALVGVALDQGILVDVNESIWDSFPEYPNIANWDQRKSQIELHHLLTMQHGLAWDEWSYPSNDPRNTNSAMWQYSDHVKYVLDLPMASQPGTTYAYGTGVSHVIGAIAANRSAQSIASFSDQYLFAPLGIDEFYWYPDPMGRATTGGGLFLSQRSLAKFGQLFLNKGVWKFDRLVSSDWVAESTSEKVDLDFNLHRDTGYGYQWWRDRFWVDGQWIDSFFTAGNGGQFSYVFPELDLVVVFTGRNYGDQSMYQPMDILESHLLPAVGQPVPTQASKQGVLPLVDRHGLRFHLFCPDGGVSPASQAQISLEGESTQSFTLTEGWHEWQPSATYPESVPFLSERQPTAVIAEYVAEDGDLVLVPIHTVSQSEPVNLEVTLPHLGEHPMWANHLVWGQDADVDLELTSGGQAQVLSLNENQTGDWILQRQASQNPFGRFLIRHQETYPPHGSGFMEYHRTDGVSGTAAIALDSGDSASDSLTMVHVAKDIGQFWSGYVLTNTHAQSVDVMATGYGSQGEEVGVAVFTIAGESQQRAVVGVDRFADLNVEWIEFRAERPLIGLELFGSADAASGYLAGLSLAASAHLDLWFPAIGNPDQWTGIALLNPVESPTEVVVQVYGESGEGHVAEVLKINLNPKQKWIGLLNEWIDGRSWSDGKPIQRDQVKAVRVRGNQPLMGFVLVGDHQRTQMAGYLGQ